MKPGRSLWSAPVGPLSLDRNGRRFSKANSATPSITNGLGPGRRAVMRGLIFKALKCPGIKVLRGGSARRKAGLAERPLAGTI